MASRTQQKAQARAQRVAEERAQAQRARRQSRLRILAGVVALAATVVAVAVAISAGSASSAPKTTSVAAKHVSATVNRLLGGIPESGNTLGSPHAKVTLTEFGDLKCPICRAFALGPEATLISKDVRAGKVKIVYRSLCTATCGGPQPGAFSTQQAAAMAAGLQGRAWYYIELFYHLQGDENTSYVNPGFLDGLARLVGGLHYGKWLHDRSSPQLAAAVSSDQRSAHALGFSGTPSVLVQGPRGARTIPYLGNYQTYESAIKAVEG
ncbi:MAG: thioredoxin domain-containing protein [Solirubrobacterales bacterium]|nr:thioredoxin domain-containing protein [Solirubrobacterales bacterium]